MQLFVADNSYSPLKVKIELESCAMLSLGMRDHNLQNGREQQKATKKVKESVSSPLFAHND